MKHFFALISLLFFMLCLLLPAVSSAEEANGTLYFGGGTSESANFQVSGVVTDTSDNLTFPADTAGTTVPSNIPELKPPASQPLPEPQGILSQIIKIIIQIAKDVADNSFAQIMNIVIAVVAGAITIILALAETVLNLPWLNLGSNTWSRFLMIFGFFKNKKRWGIVYDAESRQPISLAVVRIFDALERRLLETQLTDKDGRFGFLAKPGKYYLEAQKANYIFPSRLTVNDYHGKNIELGQDEMLSVNIPMDPQIYKISGIIGAFSKIFEVLERLQLPLAVIGTIVCVCVYIFHPNAINFLILSLYLVLWFFKLIRIEKSKLLGIVEDQSDKKIIPLAIIRVLDISSNKLVATRVSAANGKYFYLIDAGNYSVNATKENYEQYTDTLSFKHEDVLTEDIFMKKQS